MSARFALGRVVATPAALAAIDEAGQSPLLLLARHAAGDWGDVPEEDRQANAVALVNGARLMSVYRIMPQRTVWIITDAADDTGCRHSTCVLLPADY